MTTIEGKLVAASCYMTEKVSTHEMEGRTADVHSGREQWRGKKLLIPGRNSPPLTLAAALFF
jgi:hypothetical protein